MSFGIESSVVVWNWCYSAICGSLDYSKLFTDMEAAIQGKEIIPKKLTAVKLTGDSSPGVSSPKQVTPSLIVHHNFGKGPLNFTFFRLVLKFRLF